MEQTQLLVNALAAEFAQNPFTHGLTLISYEADVHEQEFEEQAMAFAQALGVISGRQAQRWSVQDFQASVYRNTAMTCSLDFSDNAKIHIVNANTARNHEKEKKLWSEFTHSPKAQNLVNDIKRIGSLILGVPYHKGMSKQETFFGHKLQDVKFLAKNIFTVTDKGMTVSSVNHKYPNLSDDFLVDFVHGNYLAPPIVSKSLLEEPGFALSEEQLKLFKFPGR